MSYQNNNSDIEASQSTTVYCVHIRNLLIVSFFVQLSQCGSIWLHIIYICCLLRFFGVFVNDKFWQHRVVVIGYVTNSQ